MKSQEEYLNNKYKELPDEQLHNHKNTHRWCKGKKGIEHWAALSEGTEHSQVCSLVDNEWVCHHYMECSKCRKHLGSADAAKCPSKLGE